MTIAREQAAGSGHGGTGGFGAQTATFANAVKSGSLLFCAWWGNSNTGNATCADNINGAWTALTQQQPVASSGRRFNLFYKLASASSSAGGLTVTVTPSANAGNSEWMQIIEYSGINAIDSIVTNYAVHASGTPATITSGVPSVTGDLILMAFAADTESVHTFSANSPMTAIVLDGTSKTAGQSNGSASLAVAEFIGASTSAVTGSMGLGSGDDGGKYIVGFKASTAATLTKTQTQIARIANNRTKTQSAISRVANTRNKTQTATSRIANIRNKTQTAIANIINSFIKTQSAIARIANNRNKTQSAVARIVAVLTKTQSAIARISHTYTKTQPAISRISNTRTKTQSATARLMLMRSFTQTATARVLAAYQRQFTQTATARIATLVFIPPTERISALYVSDPDHVYPASRAAKGLFKFFKGPQVGISVLKQHDGTYIQKSMPTQDECDAALVAYIGGHEYYVNGVEALALQAAGFTVDTRV